MPAERPIPLGAREPDGDEPDAFARLHTQQHSPFAFVLRFGDRSAHIVGLADAAARDLHDHVTSAEAVLGGDAVGLDVGHDHALVAAAGDLTGRREREPEPRDFEPRRLLGIALRSSPDLALVRQFAERERQLHFLAGPQDR